MRSTTIAGHHQLERLRVRGIADIGTLHQPRHGRTILGDLQTVYSHLRLTRRLDTICMPGPAYVDALVNPDTRRFHA